MDLTYKIVRRLLRDDDVAFSRNRNFEAFDDPKVKRAMRLYRHLRSLERDLLSLIEGGSAALEAVECEDDIVTVRLSFSGRGGKRTSYLSPREWALLLENETVHDILLSLVDEASSRTQYVLAETLNASPIEI
ncbi:MAG: hypothetical protein ACNA8W_19415 [Bradymonadaceae bacterium]